MLRFSFFVFFYFFCYFALLFSQNVSAAGGRSGLRCPPGFELEGIDCIKEIAEHPHYHCPHGFHFLSPKEGCILKETYNSVSICPNDATLDKKEDVCAYMISSTPTATCMAGYELNANKKCARRVAVTGRVECAANFKLIYEKNGTPHPTPKCIQQRFSSPEPICPSGYEMEGSGGRRQCVSEERVEAKLMCPNDYFMYGGNGCIKHLESPPSAKCESGYIYDGKDCVRYSEMPAAPTCKIGTFDGSVCLDEAFATPELICPEGYTLDISTGRCYTIKEAEPRRVCPSSFDIEVTKIEIKPSKNTGDQVHAQSTKAKSSSPHPPSSSSSSHATGSPHGSVAFHNGNNNSPSYIRQKHIVSKSNDANHYKNTAAASASPPPQPPASSTGNASASVPYKIPLRMLAGPLDYQQARNPYYNYNDNNNNNNNNYNTNHYNYRQQQQTDNNNNNFASARPLVHNVGPYDAHSHPPAHAPHIAAAPPPPPHSPPHSPPPHSPPSPPPHKSPAVSSPVPKVIFPSSPPAVQHQCRRRNIHSPEYRCPQDSQILEEGGEKKCRRTHKVPPTLVCPDNADATSEGKCLIRNKKDSIFVCPDGFVVNPTTKQCHRSTMPTQFNHCDKGVFDGGKCVEALESPPVYKCPQNSVYDKMTNSCYTIEETLPKLICGAEATLTPRNEGSTCLAKKILPTKQTCPPGTKWHSSVSKGGSQHYRQLETANGNKDNIPVKRNNGVKRNLQEVGPLHVPMHTSAEEADHDDLHEGDSGTCVKVTTARPDVVCKEGFVMLPEREDICYMTIAVPSEEANDGEDELGGRRRRGNGNGRQVQPTRLPANIPLPASRQSDYIPTTRPNGYIPLPPPPRNDYTSSPNPSRSGYMPSPPPSPPPPPPPPRNGNIPLLDDASSSLAIDTGGGGAGGGEIAPDVAGGGLPPTPPPEGGIRNAAGRASGASAGRASGASAGRASGASAGRASGASAGRASGASAGRTFGASATRASGGSVGRTSGASAGGTARLRLYNVETFDYRNYPKPDDLDDDGYYEVGGADR